MKIHGWCETCRRVRRVEVSSHGMAMMVATRGVATGECDECRERRERPRRRAR